MFNRLFGGGKRDEIPGATSKNTANVVGAIQKLAEQAELLEKRKEVLEMKIEAELTKAKQYLKQGNKAAATTCMKKKALLVKQMEGLDNNIMRVTEQQNMLEDAQMHVQTVAAMQQAAKAQKATMAEYRIEKVDQVMDEIQNVADQAAEIQQALAMPLGGAIGIDDDDIEAELADLESQQLDEELMQPALIPSTLPPAKDELQLPNVPTTAAPAGRTKKTVDEELEEMERELA